MKSHDIWGCLEAILGVLGLVGGIEHQPLASSRVKETQQPYHSHRPEKHFLTLSVEEGNDIL